MTEEQIKALQSTGGEALAETEKNILANHIPKLWEVVRDLKGKPSARIDFILDNAGFELYCDCVYGACQPPKSWECEKIIISYGSRLPDAKRVR